MAPPVLYTALTDLRIDSAYASWPWPEGRVAPLRPDADTTKILLANGSIEPAAEDAIDDTTPANMLRGQPGLHDPRTVSN
jgi:hypothetical protein